MNVKEAKTIPLVLILEKIGYQPVRERNGEAVYFSPLREERTPSFHVNAARNAWYDFGEGVGGNGLDFVCAFLASQREANTIHDALRWLFNMTGNVSVVDSYSPNETGEKTPCLTVKKISRITHKVLTGYLETRGIPLSLASPYLSELNVYNAKSQKRFFALGMRNEEDGYELRNPFFKGCVGTKAVTFIRGSIPKPEGLHLFEGMFDFVSALAFKELKQLPEDAIILHSLSCLKQATPYIANYGYRHAYTWLDNDKAGDKARQVLEAFFKTEKQLRHHPMNSLYLPHKDVNAWHFHKRSLSL